MKLTIADLPQRAFHSNVPRINQADPEINAVKDCPYTHCAPVSITQSLIGLATRVPRLNMLLPAIGDVEIKSYQSQIIEQLAADMGTSSDTSSPNAGTTPQQLIEGLHRFVSQRNFRLTDTEWQGWGAGEIDEKLKSIPPSKAWIASGLARDDQEITEHIGWYVKGDNGIYIRKGGHFITAVGYDKLDTNLESLIMEQREVKLQLDI